MLNTLPVERYILACILNEKDVIWEINTILEPKDFTYGANGLIFAKCKELREKDQELDILTVYNAFPDSIKKIIDGADPIGNGLKYIEVLKNSPYSIANLAENVKILKSVSIRRKLAEITGSLNRELEASDKIFDTNKLVESCLNKIVNVALTEEEAYRTGQIGEGLRDYLSERMKNPSPIVGYRTGFPKLDSVLGGIQESKLTVLLARPKVGKSTMLLNWAKFLAVDQNIPVLYLDTEMITNEQQTRLLAMSANVDEKKLINGLFGQNEVEKKRVMDTIPLLEQAPLYHVYLPNFSMDTIIAYARKFKVRYGIKALFFDYIKWPDMGGLQEAQEWQLLGYLTTCLKNQIAGQLELAVVTAGQFNRNDQVAGSDRILHYANTIIGLRIKKPEEVAEESGKRGQLAMTILASRNTEDKLSFDVMFKKPRLQMSEIGFRSENGSDFNGID